jgi:hypothetical protein
MGSNTVCLVKTIHLNPSNLNGLVWGVTTVAVDGSGGNSSILCCLSETLCWLWLATAKEGVLLADDLSSEATTDVGRDDNGTGWLAVLPNEGRLQVSGNGLTCCSSWWRLTYEVDGPTLGFISPRSVAKLFKEDTDGKVVAVNASAAGGKFRVSSRINCTGGGGGGNRAVVTVPPGPAVVYRILGAPPWPPPPVTRRRAGPVDAGGVGKRICDAAMPLPRSGGGVGGWYADAVEEAATAGFSRER